MHIVEHMHADSSQQKVTSCGPTPLSSLGCNAKLVRH